MGAISGPHCTGQPQPSKMDWLGHLGPTESWQTECRGIPSSSPETWLPARPNPTAHPSPSRLALKLGSPGHPSTRSHVGLALVLPPSTGPLCWVSPHYDSKSSSSHSGCRCWHASATPGTHKINIRDQQPVQDCLQTRVQTQAKEQRHERIPCSPPSPWGMFMGDPTFILPQVRRRTAAACHCFPWPSTPRPQRSKMRSNAPTPSIDTTVAFSSELVSACTCGSQPQSLLVQTGTGTLPPTQLGTTAGSMRATSQRKKSPTTMPRTLPCVCSARSHDPTEWPS